MLTVVGSKTVPKRINLREETTADGDDGGTTDTTTYYH